MSKKISSNHADQVIALLFGISRLMRSKMTRASGNDHVNWLQIHALFLIDEHKGLTMKELAQSLMVTAPTATAFVNRLVRGTLVRRSSDPTNRKLVRLHLTAAGLRMMKTKLREKQRLMREVIDILPAKDQRELARIFKQLLDSHFRTSV